MRNWDMFVMISSVIIIAILIFSKRLEVGNLFDGLQMEEAIWVAIKTLAITFLVVLSVFSLLVLVIADVMLTFFMRYDFPILHWMHEKLYNDILISWYWESHTSGNILMACIILLGIALIYTFLAPFFYRKRGGIYVKKK